MTSEVSICNQALQRVGSKRIVSLSENSVAARECNLAYEPTRDAELRKYKWNFAKTRVVLSPDTSSPAFGYKYQFTLPSDWLRTLHDEDEHHDWRMESGKILTNEGDVLNLSYIRRVTNPNEFDALFVQSLAAAIALKIVEPLTQSNTKKTLVKDDYGEAIAEAKRTNSIEKEVDVHIEDDWVSVRV